MTACVCARCEAMVTTDNKIPTTPTNIPTRRVFGSAACSGFTSISGMNFQYLRQIKVANLSVKRSVPRRGCAAHLFDHAQARIAARNAENPAAHHFDDLAECSDRGHEFSDLEFRTGQFGDVARRI